MRRNPLAIFFLPDPGRDGVVSFPEWIRHVAARAILALSIGFCAWTVAVDLLGPLLGGLFGIFGLLIGWIAGTIIGSVAPFMEAFGIFFISRARTWGGKLGYFLLMAFCMVITVGAMGLLASHVIAADRERLELAENADALVVERAGAMRDTSGAEQRMTDARSDLEIALGARNRAESLREELGALPSATYHPRIAEIQSIIGTTPDGVTYNLTTEAMAAYAARAQTEYDAAVQRRDAAQAALDAVTQTVSSGAVAEVELSAVNAAKTFSIVKSFRQLAYLSFKTRGDERQNDPVAIDERAKNFADLFAFILVLAINVLNFGLNNTGHKARPPETPAKPDALAIEDRSGEPIPPDGGGAQVWARGEVGAESADPAFVARHTPRQPFETPKYLQNVRARLAKGSGYGYADSLNMRLDELDERGQRAMDALALADKVREIEELERRAEEAARRIQQGNGFSSAPAAFEERTTVRRSSSTPRPTAAPPERPVVVGDPNDKEEIERLRREIAERNAEAARAAAAAAETADLDRSPRDPGGAYGVEALEDLAAKWNALKEEFQRLDAELKKRKAALEVETEEPRQVAIQRRIEAIEARMHVIHGEMVAIPDPARRLAALSSEAAQ